MTMNDIDLLGRIFHEEVFDHKNSEAAVHGLKNYILYVGYNKTLLGEMHLHPFVKKEPFQKLAGHHFKDTLRYGCTRIVTIAYKMLFLSNNSIKCRCD